MNTRQTRRVTRRPPAAGRRRRRRLRSLESASIILQKPRSLRAIREVRLPKTIGEEFFRFYPEGGGLNNRISDWPNTSGTAVDEFCWQRELISNRILQRNTVHGPELKKYFESRQRRVRNPPELHGGQAFLLAIRTDQDQRKFEPQTNPLLINKNIFTRSDPNPTKP